MLESFIYSRTKRRGAVGQFLSKVLKIKAKSEFFVQPQGIIGIKQIFSGTYNKLFSQEKKSPQIAEDLSVVGRNGRK